MIYNEETGEIIKDKFVQLYFKDISRLLDLSKVGYGVLFLMAKSIGLGNTNSLKMTPKRKKEFAKQINCSVRQIHNVIIRMEKEDIIKKKSDDRYDFEYTINPNILFSGNEYQRVKILIEYSDGKRKFKTFQNKNDLTKYLKGKENE